jgi:hypothetical protein
MLTPNFDFKKWANVNSEQNQTIKNRTNLYLLYEWLSEIWIMHTILENS